MSATLPMSDVAPDSPAAPLKGAQWITKTPLESAQLKSSLPTTWTPWVRYEGHVHRSGQSSNPPYPSMWEVHSFVGAPLVLVSQSTRVPLAALYLETLPENPAEAPTSVFYKHDTQSHYCGLVNQTDAPFRLVLLNLRKEAPIGFGVYHTNSESSNTVNEFQVVNPRTHVYCETDNTTENNAKLGLKYQTEVNSAGVSTRIEVEVNEAKPVAERRKALQFRILVNALCMLDQALPAEEADVWKETRWITADKMPYWILESQAPLPRQGWDNNPYLELESAHIRGTKEIYRKPRAAPYIGSYIAPQPQCAPLGLSRGGDRDREGSAYRGQPRGGYSWRRGGSGGGGRGGSGGGRGGSRGPAPSERDHQRGYVREKEYGAADSDDDNSFSFGVLEKGGGSDDDGDLEADEEVEHKEVATKCKEKGPSATQKIINKAYMVELVHGEAVKRTAVDSKWYDDPSNVAPPLSICLYASPSLQAVIPKPYAKEAFMVGRTGVLHPMNKETKMHHHVVWRLYGDKPAWEFDASLFPSMGPPPTTFGDTCMICLGDEPDLVVLPCNHLALHMPPAADCQLTLPNLCQMDTCILCRGTITAYIQKEALDV